MPRKTPEITWKNVKSILAKEEPSELLALLQQLYALNEDNRRFIHARLRLGDPLRQFKTQIEAGLCPDPMSSDEEFSIATARKAISDYRKAADDPLGTLELMVYFVECGTQCTLNYGDMWEEYYDSLESMFGRAVKALLPMDKKTINAYLPRLEKLVRDTEDIGWGYHDGLTGALSEAFPEADV